MNPYMIRRFVIAAIITLVIIVFIGRLFALQVVNSTYKLSAENNSRRFVTEYPARGLIYDRNGEILVANQAAYDLMVNPLQLKEFDTTSLCEILEVEKEDLITGIKSAIGYSRYKPSVVFKQVSSETYAILQEKLYKYPGFFVQSRTLRKYPREIASQVLGYVGEVDERIIKDYPYYQMGDYIGISGIEKTYEEYLRGRKGVKIYLVDVHNRIKGSYQNGRYDTTSIVGLNLTSSIDGDLQAYGERLMKRMKGSIVALEPKTGEILSLVSSPVYQPSLLVGRVRNKNYKALSRDTLNPLFNRALMAKYPPGSTFKLLTGLIGLKRGVIYKGTEYYCDLGYYAGHMFKKCHPHYSPLDLVAAVQNSCNTYFFQTFRRIIEDPNFQSVSESYSNWRDDVVSFGFGKKLDTDFTNELSGFIPETSYYDHYYGENRWKALTIISLAIGQGELGITPVQMANMAAVMANRGYYYTPHIIKDIEGGVEIDKRFREKNFTNIDSTYFEPIIRGMELAVNGGAGSTARIARLQDIVICGKTGTAENPHGQDHSIFVAFAPKDDPKIAIAVYVENGGYGATWAAPIASLMIEKYLKGSVSRSWLENYILSADLIYPEEIDEENR